MKVIKVMLFVLLAVRFTPSYAESATKDDIKLVIHQMDKRFEQVDKRFEQVDKRLDLILWVIGLATIFTTGVLSFLILRMQRIEDQNRSGAIKCSDFVEMIHTISPQEKKIIKDLLKV